jgi:hypothetical protein
LHIKFDKFFKKIYIIVIKKWSKYIKKKKKNTCMDKAGRTMKFKKQWLSQSMYKMVMNNFWRTIRDIIEEEMKKEVDIG